MAPADSVDTTMRPAERQADQLLRTVWKRDGDAFVVPVDPFEIARRLGLQVYVAELDPDVSGMLVKRPGEEPEVYVNARDHENRQRFSCAHEIGHYLLRASADTDDSFGYIDRRSELASQGTNKAEIYANQFAAELLMPRDQVRRSVRDTGAVESLAGTFGVSTDAMKYRLANLGIH